MIKIQVIIGSTRQNRSGHIPAQWIFSELQKQKNVDAELIDLRDYQLPFFDEPVSPSTSGGKYTNNIATKWAKKVSEGDGFIIVTPEYNHGYPAILKNALDYVYKEWNNKPVAFVSYGGISGGIRSVEQLREVVIELGLIPTKTGVHIPFFRKLIDDKGNFNAEHLQKNADTLLKELLFFAELLKTAREK